MSGEALREGRMKRGLTQAQVAMRLGVSQAYVALLERERRRVPLKLARRVVRELKLDPVLLPASGKNPFAVGADNLARDLSRLGYPGFAYLRGGWLKNPGEVVLAALAQPELDSRLAEALPWVLLKYPEVDAKWLVSQARLLNLTNRLGFVVDLARGVAKRKGETNSPRYAALSRLAELLVSSRPPVEDTLGQASLSVTERNWLRDNASAEARFWNVLSDWQPEFLQYTE